MGGAGPLRAPLASYDGFPLKAYAHFPHVIGAQVTPGALMPAVEAYQKQDYAVLFIVGLEASMP